MTPPGGAVSRYDEAYFDRWYRSRTRVVTPRDTLVKARFALAAAEYMLGREVRSVLDVGCGEGEWRAVLRRMRPRLRWVGVDPSPYVVQRFGRRRNIRQGRFGELGRLRFRSRFDLIVCANTLQYVPTPELRRGLRAVRRLLRGVAWLEAFASEDVVEGDVEGWIHRSARTLRAEFRRAGLIACGLHSYIARSEAYLSSALERAR